MAEFPRVENLRRELRALPFVRLNNAQLADLRARLLDGHHNNAIEGIEPSPEAAALCEMFLRERAPLAVSEPFVDQWIFRVLVKDGEPAIGYGMVRVMTVGSSRAEWQLAQINVGRLVAPSDDGRVKPFFDALDRVNAMADASPGFIWRLQSEAGNATDIKPTSDPLFIVNMSVWANADALFSFVYRSGHAPEMARRREYFERFEGAYQALWWVPAGHTPSVDEGLSRLWRLDRYGPTQVSFTFKVRFPTPGMSGPPFDMQPDPWCVGRA